ncbi:MAG TPA: carboxypeptidase regulatory-like domain-containing protein [Polyangiaceae bacterium]|jgi:hypothetical protein
MNASKVAAARTKSRIFPDIRAGSTVALGTGMRLFFFSAVAVAMLACSPSSGTDDAGPADTGTSDVTTNDVVVPSDGGGPSTVTFAYTPQWSGVTAVTVFGGFGQATDWTAPFATLTSDGKGGFTAQAKLPSGQYLYVFKVVGDADAGTNAAKYPRFAIDPSDSDFAPCPSESPTYDANNPNPCSELTVPQSTPAALAHVSGVVVSDGAPIAGYLVQLDREEKNSHHFFVNRVTTQSDGKFDLLAAPGSYRIQVLHPTFLSETDEQRDPKMLAALRRDISSAFPVASGTLTIPSPEVAFHGYGSFSPVDSGTLPTTFTFDSNSNKARLDVYGTGKDGGAPSIGDPWYSSALTTSGSAVFDGGFDTPQANETSAALGERYFWGIEENLATDAGVTWTAQSMVFDITFH